MDPLRPRQGTDGGVFEARDQNGRAHTLATLTGPVGLVLVVVRSADW